MLAVAPVLGTVEVQDWPSLRTALFTVLWAAASLSRRASPKGGGWCIAMFAVAGSAGLLVSYLGGLCVLAAPLADDPSARICTGVVLTGEE